MNAALEELAQLAQAGNRSALEQLVEQIQDKVYGLALRMLWHPEDAQDATQEILIRVITRLSSFRGERQFMTWVYRVAANYLSDVRKSRLEAAQYTFERFGAELDEGLAETLVQLEPAPDEALLMEEIKIGCTLGMLLCLDRPQRLVYILGEILEIESQEAASILDLTPAAFRKRLSRARAEIVSFTKQRCGLVNPANACRCRGRINYARAAGRLNPAQLLFAHETERATHFPAVLGEIRKLEEARRATALYRSHPPFGVPESFVGFVRELIGAGKI